MTSMWLSGDVVRVHPVIARGRDVDRAVVVPDALGALELRAAAHLLAGRHAACGGVRYLAPADRAVLGHRRDLEQAGAEVVPVRGREAVDAAVHEVLGQVDPPAARVHRGRLVLEGAHGRAGQAAPLAGRVAFPHEAAHHLLAREPGAPWGRPARAVLGGAVEDAVGGPGLRVGAEAHGRGAAVEHLGVGDEDPAAVVRGEARHPVRGLVPAVVRARRPAGRRGRSGASESPPGAAGRARSPGPAGRSRRAGCARRSAPIRTRRPRTWPRARRRRQRPPPLR